MPDVETPHRIEAIPILSDNYVWVLHDGSHALVVDPGEDRPVDAWLRQRELVLTTILVTHHHADHIGGVPGLCERWPGVVVIAPEDPRVPMAHRRVGEGDRIDLKAPASSFQVWAIPGHTLSHVAYVGEGLTFCGDTLFSVGCGRLFEGTPAQMLTSLQRLARLPGDTLVCCTHEYTQGNCAFAMHADPGNTALIDHAAWVDDRRRHHLGTLPSRIDRERAINPFLRTEETGVRHALHAQRGLASSASPEQAFAALRAWKDGFRG